MLRRPRTWEFIAPLSIKVRKWEQPTCLSAELDKENRTYTHSAVLFSFSVTRIELENIVPGGVSHAQKDSHHVVHVEKKLKGESQRSASVVIQS